MWDGVADKRYHCHSVYVCLDYLLAARNKDVVEVYSLIIVHIHNTKNVFRSYVRTIDLIFPLSNKHRWVIIVVKAVACRAED